MEKNSVIKIIIVFLFLIAFATACGRENTSEIVEKMLEEKYGKDFVFIKGYWTTYDLYKAEYYIQGNEQICVEVEYRKSDGIFTMDNTYSKYVAWLIQEEIKNEVRETFPGGFVYIYGSFSGMEGKKLNEINTYNTDYISIQVLQYSEINDYEKEYEFLNKYINKYIKDNDGELFIFISEKSIIDQQKSYIDNLVEKKLNNNSYMDIPLEGVRYVVYTHDTHFEEEINISKEQYEKDMKEIRGNYE